MQLRPIISRIAVAFPVFAACLAVAGTASAGINLAGFSHTNPAPPTTYVKVYVPKLECYTDYVKGADGYSHPVKVCKP